MTLEINIKKQLVKIRLLTISENPRNLFYAPALLARNMLNAACLEQPGHPAMQCCKSPQCGWVTGACRNLCAAPLAGRARMQVGVE